MYRTEADSSGRVVTMSFSEHVGSDEMSCCFNQLRALLDHMQPGFLLLTDLSGLDSMDVECAACIGEIMDLCNAKGIKRVVRIVPDPRKDIGFNLVARFHQAPNVEVSIYESLAEAIRCLSCEDAGDV
ncbi:MAG: hypothetical protein JWL90_1856 [Chthoniobacteraceae bacterium]|nr:hypothetical protein [Chthoniobacteraceae bacterium]